MREQPSKETIKAIVLDLDGTLLSPDHTVLPQTKRTLLNLQEEGIKLIFSTGRTFRAAEGNIRDFHSPMPMVLSGGAIIHDPVKKRACRTVPLGEDVVSLLYETSKREGIHIQFFSADHNYISEEDRKIYRPFDPFSDMRPLEEGKTRGKEIVKAMVYGADIETTGQPFFKRLQETFPGRLYIVSTFRNHYEIMNSRVNKGVGLAIVSTMTGISLSSMMVFGDADSDIDMMKVARWSVAMGNASPEAKAEADAITADNASEGIAIYLRRFFAL